MNSSALILAIAIGMGATACGSSHSTPASPSNADGDSTEPGAANSQPGDNPARLLTHDECVQLGGLVSDACRDIHARSAQVEGWCNDVVASNESGAWVEDCAKHIHLIDSMCFRTANNARGMMTCDRTVEH
ncbi:MAG TPA: hypothetical protein VMI75_05205 [Polyangiaceae bacterium]|nr:hypothetical protein [Polyangiaceae bacterium]